MSIDSALSGAQSISTTIGSATNLVSRLASDLGAKSTSTTLWADQLRTASFRGVPFGVIGGSSKFGRRNAVHEYPFRDAPWVEDLGKSARRFNVSGFLVENAKYGGTPSVITQREQMIAACENKGEGELVHPTFGRLKVSNIDFSVEERSEQGRVFEVRLSFIETGKRIFPGTETSTANDVESKVTAVVAASKVNFLSSIATAIKKGAAVVAAVVSKAAAWGRLAQRLVNDATNLYHMVSTLSGQIGRYFSGAGLSGSSKTQTSQSTIATLIAAGSVSRAAVSTASDALSVSAAALSSSTAGDFADSVQSMVTALYSASVRPADAMRLLSSMMDTPANSTSSSSGVGSAITTVQGATDDLFRRTAVASVALASADYQPASADDAATVRTMVCDLLDSEIAIAGNQGEDETFNALRELRAAVSQDLTTRGAGLATIVTVTSIQPVPAPVLAQRLYRDPARADELVGQADPVHPAFMPVSFKALAS